MIDTISTFDLTDRPRFRGAATRLLRPLRLRAEADAPDSPEQRSLRASYWFPIGSDSIVVIWSDRPLTGLHLRLAVHGDSLTGAAQSWGDLDSPGWSYVSMPVRGARIECPASGSRNLAGAPDGLWRW